MSSIEEGLIRQMKRDGIENPEQEVLNKPKLTQDLIFYYNSFLELDSERNHGHGLMKIPRSKVKEFVEECGFETNEGYEFIRLIRAVDDAHLAHLAEKLEAASKK